MIDLSSSSERITSRKRQNKFSSKMLKANQSKTCVGFPMIDNLRSEALHLAKIVVCHSKKIPHSEKVGRLLILLILRMEAKAKGGYPRRTLRIPQAKVKINHQVQIKVNLNRRKGRVNFGGKMFLKIKSKPVERIRNISLHHLVRADYKARQDTIRKIENPMLKAKAKKILQNKTPMVLFSSSPLQSLRAARV